MPSQEAKDRTLVVIITGCSSGIGRESALEFARNGDRVYACVRDVNSASSLERQARKEQIDIRIRILDVTETATFEAVIGEILDDSGYIDVLINNAGILHAGAWEDLSEAQARLVMDTNFFGPMLLARTVLPHMRKQNSGSIIMISSLSGLAGLAGDVAYTASKFALEGASEALRFEVERWGIQVALVEAGQHATKLLMAASEGDNGLPPGYPHDSPYKALVAYRTYQAQSKPNGGLPAANVAKLLPVIARADGSQFRWQADAAASAIVHTLLGQSDSERSNYLRAAGDTKWWSSRDNAPDRKSDE